MVTLYVKECHLQYMYETFLKLFLFLWADDAFQAAKHGPTTVEVKGGLTESQKFPVNPNSLSKRGDIHEGVWGKGD